MTKYTPQWDLGTIPADKLHSEVGRRRRSVQGPASPNIKLRPCQSCGEPLTATQRRKKCPACGYTHPRVPAASAGVK